MTPRSIARRIALALSIALMHRAPAWRCVARATGSPAPSQTRRPSQRHLKAHRLSRQPKGRRLKQLPPRRPGGPAYDIEIVIFRAAGRARPTRELGAETTASATVAGGEAASGSGQAGRLLAVLPASNYSPDSHRVETRVPAALCARRARRLGADRKRLGNSRRLSARVPGNQRDRPHRRVFLERGEFLHLGMTLNYTMQDPPPGLNAACRDDLRDERDPAQYASFSATTTTTRRSASLPSSPRRREHGRRDAEAARPAGYCSGVPSSCAPVKSQVAPPRSSRAQRTRSREAAMNQVSCARGLPRPNTAGSEHGGTRGVLRVAHRFVADDPQLRRAGCRRQ